MQVKKFEATTIQEALEMVKNTLGPEAIILNAKDNTGSFGLMGKKSIEVTAAISEKQLLKKQWAESRLKEEELAKLRTKPARVQKQFIERSVERYTKKVQDEEAAKRPVTQVRYIDIEDEGESRNLQGARGRTVESVLTEIGAKTQFVETPKGSESVTSTQRVRQAAQSAYKIFEESVSRPVAATSPAVSSQASLNEVQSLKNEIMQLKTMLQSLSQPVLKNEPDFKLHPGAEYGVSFEMSATFYKLTQAGISAENTLELLELAKKELGFENIRKQALLEGWIAKTMMGQIQVKNPLAQKPIHIFMGPSGSGKSSSLVKMASYFVLNKNKKVGILTCDSERVGAVDQLRIYSQILNVPFGILKGKSDWNTITDSLRSLDVILVDYPGTSLKEIDQIEKLRDVLPNETVPCERHLVLSAGIKEKDAFEITERYKVAKPTDVIFTKLDEAISHGLIYNFQRKYDLPLHSFGIGPKLPEDYEFASKERVVDLIFKITKFGRKE